MVNATALVVARGMPGGTSGGMAMGGSRSATPPRTAPATSVGVQPFIDLQSLIGFRYTALALCALALLLRWYHIGTQSLWYDEALSVSLAAKPLAGMIQQLAQQDVHPPLYFALLHFWMVGTGSSEAAVRALSALWGVLGVAALIALGTRLGGRAVGLVAGALASASPLLVYYGQETRMYAMLACLATVATYAFVRAARGERRWWLVAAVSLGCALLTHLAASFLLVALNAWYVGSVIVQRRRLDSRERDWLLAQLGSVALFAPWLPVAISTFRNYGSAVYGGPVAWMLEQTVIVFSLGHEVVGLAVVPGTADFDAQDALARRLLVPFLVAVLLGLVAWRRHLPLLLAWLLVPTIAIVALAVRMHGFDARYLIASSPAFLLLVAGGLVWCWRRPYGRPAGALLALAVAGASGFALSHAYGDPVYARDDNRAVVQLLDQRAAPGAGIVLDAGFQPAFEYYAHGRFTTINLPATVPASADQVGQALSAFTAQHGQVWLLLWHDYYTDPQRLVWNWLLQHRYAADWINVNDDFKVLRFDAPPPNLQPSGAAFGNAITLVGTTTQVAGDMLRVDLFWRAIGVPQTDDHIVLHVIDAAGNVYGQAETPPAGGDLPTTAWQAGDHYHTTAMVPLAAWTAPGPYRLQVQLDDPRTATDYPASGPGTVSTSAMVPLTLPTLAPLPLPQEVRPLNAAFSGVGTLSGYSLNADDGNVTITLFWKALGPAATNYKVFVHALTGGSQVLADGDSEPVAGGAPTTSWRAGELLRDPHHLTLLSGQAAALYEVGLYDPVSGVRVAVGAAEGTVVAERAVRLPG